MTTSNIITGINSASSKLPVLIRLAMFRFLALFLLIVNYLCKGCEIKYPHTRFPDLILSMFVRKGLKDKRATVSSPFAYSQKNTN